MNSFGTIVNLPVREQESGKTIGRLADVVLKNGTNHIEAIRIESGKLVKKTIMVEASRIIQLDGQQITISSQEALNHRPQEQEHNSGESQTGMENPRESGLGAEKTGSGRSYLRDYAEKKVMTNKGMYLGKIKEGYFDFEIGSLCEFEISGGFADDFILGRQKLTTEGPVLASKNSVTVEEDKTKLQSKSRFIEDGHMY